MATSLNNLAGLLRDTNRQGEAEPLYRRQMEIFRMFTEAIGHGHPHHHASIGNDISLLDAMGRTPD